MKVGEALSLCPKQQWMEASSSTGSLQISKPKIFRVKTDGVFLWLSCFLKETVYTLLQYDNYFFMAYRRRLTCISRNACNSFLAKYSFIFKLQSLKYNVLYLQTVLKWIVVAYFKKKKCQTLIPFTLMPCIKCKWKIKGRSAVGILIIM